MAGSKSLPLLRPVSKTEMTPPLIENILKVPSRKKPPFYLTAFTRPGLRLITHYARVCVVTILRERDLIVCPHIIFAANAIILCSRVHTRGPLLIRNYRQSPWVNNIHIYTLSARRKRSRRRLSCSSAISKEYCTAVWARRTKILCTRLSSQ